MKKFHIIALNAILLAFCANLLTSCMTMIPVTDANRQVNNFTFYDGQVTWENVFPYEASDSAAVREWFRQSFNLSRDSVADVLGESFKNPLPYEQVGYNYMNIPIILRYPCTINFHADFKGDRMKVRVNQIIWYPDVTTSRYGLQQTLSTMTLNEVATKDGGYNSAFYNVSSDSINKMLQQVFMPKIQSMRSNEDW